MTTSHDRSGPDPETMTEYIGVSRATFEHLVGSDAEPDFTALDRVLPHPVYARQH